MLKLAIEAAGHSSWLSYAILLCLTPLLWINIVLFLLHTCKCGQLGVQNGLLCRFSIGYTGTAPTHYPTISSGENPCNLCCMQSTFENAFTLTFPLLSPYQVWDGSLQEVWPPELHEIAKTRSLCDEETRVQYRCEI